MYSVMISSKNYDLVDFFDVNKMLKKFEGKREQFPARFSEKIQDFYEDIFLKNDIEYIESQLYLMQLLINDCYNYILDGEAQFVDYYAEKLKKKQDLSKNELKKHKTKANICFNPAEVAEKVANYSKDNLDLFYYFSFTNFFLNEYLLELFVMFPDLFKKGSFNKKELNFLNSYLMKIFSVEFAEAFNNFEAEQLRYN